MVRTSQQQFEYIISVMRVIHMCAYKKRKCVCVCVCTRAHMCGLIVYVCELYMPCKHTVIHTHVLW